MYKTRRGECHIRFSANCAFSYRIEYNLYRQSVKLGNKFSETTQALPVFLATNKPQDAIICVPWYHPHDVSYVILTVLKDFICKQLFYKTDTYLEILGQQP